MERKSSRPLKLFYCYARKDQDLRDELDIHLSGLRRSGLITDWYDGEISPGTSWEQEIEIHLDTAHIILLLVSPNFLYSDYCYSKEMIRAIERHRRKEARVIPILLRPADWTDTPFTVLQVLPSNARPVTSWTNRDAAFEDVVRGIRGAVNNFLAQRITNPNSATSTEFPSQAIASGQQREKQVISHKWSKRALLLLGSITDILLEYKFVFLTILLCIFAALGVGTLLSVLSLPPQTPYPPYRGNLVLDDPLVENSYGYDWGVGSDPYGNCTFSDSGYHVRAQDTTYIHNCTALETGDFTNFIYEVKMKIIQGDCGGLLFRMKESGPDAYYGFTVCQQGIAILVRCDANANQTHCTVLYSLQSSTINRGVNQTNLIAVIAQGSSILLYVNHQKLYGTTDDKYKQGLIGLEADPQEEHVTEIIYSDAKVWQI